MSESDAAVKTGRISDDVNARLQLQSQRMDEMSNAVHEARKTSVYNVETMQEIRIAIENLGDNFQKMQEKMLQWDEPEQFMDVEEEREYNENVSTLLTEVSLPPLAKIFL